MTGGGDIRSIPVPQGSRMTPAVYDGKIVIVNLSGSLLICNAETGGVDSTISTNSEQSIAMAVKIDGDNAYFAGKNGTVVCVNLYDEKVVWQKRLSESRDIAVFNDLEIGKNAVYAYSQGVIYAVSKSDGSPLFTISRASAPPAYNDGMIFFGTVDGKLNMADAATGKIVSSILSDGTISSRPEISGRRIIIGTEIGSISIINISEWKNNVSG